jgi:nucleoside-triphosphatase
MLVMWVFETFRGSHPNLNIRGFYTHTALLRLLELRFVRLCDDHAFYQFLCAVSICRRGERGGERIGLEVVTIDDRTGPLSSRKVSRLLLCIYACSKF